MPLMTPAGQIFNENFQVFWNSSFKLKHWKHTFQNNLKLYRLHFCLQNKQKQQADNLQ